MSYICEEVVLFSLTYHNSIYDVHAIRVYMHDDVFLAALTAVTERVVGNTKATNLLHQGMHVQFVFQLVTVLVMMTVNALIFNWSWLMISCKTLCLCLPFCWLIWSLLGTGAWLVLLRYVVGNVPESFTHSLHSLPFLRHFCIAWASRSELATFRSRILFHFSQYHQSSH